MADFDLTQTGQEVQNILDGAAMQTDLTAEVDRAELAEQTLQGNINIEETRAKAAEKQNADDIDVIEGKIPAAASDENQLADKNFVNSSIATATATYRGAYNLVSDLSLTVDATHEQIATALAGEISNADNNDYCFVQIPTSSETPTQIASIERYKFNGSAWAYEYTLNNSGFTADQWAALNSGITSGLVAKLTALPTNDELTLALAGKQNVLTFDNVPIENSNNPVKSSGVYSAIGNEETRAKAAEKANADDIDAIEEKIPAAASSENQLADKSFVNSSIATATATFKGTYNLVNDLSLTIDATHEQIAAALANEISTADNNDYCFVQIPTSIETPTQIASIERYKFNGSAWAYEYTLNNSGFTADQWAALNSGITSGLVAKLTALPTNSEIVLALAGKQDVLTFDNEPTENSNNPVKSGGVYDAIDVEATTRAAAIAAIVALIPEAASALNQLADKSFVNSSISTATAVFKGTFNVVVDFELSYNATQEQIALMLASKIIAADNNDYCFVQIPTSDETPLQIARTDRYKFNGSVWAYEYTLNNSGFTSVQWAAINSGITSLLKDKLIDLPTATELTALLAAKQNELTFDTAPTTGSTNPVTSGGVKTAIDAEATRAEAAEEALDTDKADKATTLAGYGITDAYTKSETYNKTEVNGLVSTPHQEYVTVATYASLPASGSTDTIYRVSSYDGANSQVDDTVYSEYAWDGTQYVFLCVKSQIEEVFDITVYNNNTKYADLAAALGVDGANIPATLRRGGMSVKFVQSSDNKYVQYRCIADEFTIDETKWVGEEIKVKNSNVDFAISDDNHKDIVQFANGHVKTKNFDSSQKATDSLDGLMSKEDKQKLNGIEENAEVNDTAIDNTNRGDLEFSDEDDNVLVRFKNGHIKTKNFDSKDIEERVSDLEGRTNNNIILTIGDSLTEGAGSGKNYKGETVASPYTYTSWMQTKTADYVFSRHGIGGENSAAILGRMFGAPLVVGEKFTLPANTSTVQVNLVSSWYDRTNEGRRSQNLGGASGTVRDTNPCTINGIPVTLSLSSGTYYIQRNTAASESADILADTPIIPTNFTTYKDSAYGLVFWCGTNDSVSSEFTDELIEHIRKTAEKYNTDRYVVVGIHYITAEITLAMRQRQEVQFQDAFGDRFINWREYASNFAIRDAIARGYIEDSGTYPTAADITAMSEGKVPPTLLVDTVHLCEEGYMLVGDLIFERLVSLGYINDEL